MRFSHIAVIYFIMGMVMLATGVIGPGDDLGVATEFVNVGPDGGVEENQENVSGDGGMLDNLIGPIRNALNTITGGALLAIWEPVSAMTGVYAWPLTTLDSIGAPKEAKMLGGVLVASFTFGIFRVLKASI